MKVYQFLVFLFLITLTACHTQGSVNHVDSNDSGIYGDDVNLTIIVFAPQEWNTFKFIDPVKLDVVLKSDHTIILDDHDAKLYIFVNDKWKPIENQNPHPSNVYIIEPIGPEAFRGAEVIVVPNLGQQTDIVQLRIVVSAKIYDNKVVGKTVFAYIDVTLHP